jgi:hypothetical protein
MKITLGGKVLLLSDHYPVAFDLEGTFQAQNP